MRFTKIRHARAHVRPDGCVAAQHLAQRRLRELGSHAGEQWRQPAFVAEVVAGGQEQFVAGGIRSAEIRARVAGGTVQLTHAMMGAVAGRPWLGFGLQRSGNGGALGGAQVKMRCASGGLRSEATALEAEVIQRYGDSPLHLELGRVVAIGAIESRK